MKKCISLFLVLLVLSFSIAAAEQNEFTFKNDIHFCDTIDTVKNKDEDVRNSEDRGPYYDLGKDKYFYSHCLKADDIELADAIVDLFYFFDNDSQLKEIMYTATTYRWDTACLPASDMVSLYDKLFNALTQKYGTQMSDNDIRRTEIIGPVTSCSIYDDTKRTNITGNIITYRRVEHNAWLLEFDHYKVKIDLGLSIRESDERADVTLGYYYLTDDEYSTLNNTVDNNSI